MEHHPTMEVSRVEDRRASDSGVHPVSDRGESRRVDSGVYSMPGETARRHSSGAYRMPTAERDSLRPSGAPVRTPKTPSQKLSKPATPPPPPLSTKSTASSPEPDRAGPRGRTGRTEEVPAAASTPPVPSGSPQHPDTQLKQKAVSSQMTFDGAPFPGNESGKEEPPPEEDGIFIGLELPDPRTLARPGQPDS